MGKTKRKSSSDAATKKSSEIEEEQKVVEEERYASDLVKLKVENQKLMNKSVSKMESTVKKTLEAKQVI